MRHVLASFLVAASASSLLAGCGDRASLWTTGLAIGGPYKAADRVLWTDGTRGRAFVLDPTAAQPGVATVPVGRNIQFATPTPARSALLVLAAGREATKKGQDPEPPTLTVVNPGAGGKAPSVAQRYELPVAFSRVAVTPDEKFAVAYYGAGATTDALLRNPNELAIIDLTKPPAEGNPTFRTIRSLGSAPLAIAFSPPMTIGATAARTLAVVLSRDYVTFLDLDHLARPEITVPLVAEDATDHVTPKQVVFSPESTSLLLRADGASDVFSIALDPRPGLDAAQNDYRPRINQPSAGKVPLDMMLYKDGGRSLILTANTTADLALIDAATSEFSIIPVGAPVDAILPVPAKDPQIAIVFSRSSPQAFVHFVELADLAKNGAQNLTRRTLARAVHDLVPMPGGTQVLVVHDDARTVVSILDLGPRRVDTPIEGRVALESFDFAGDRWMVGVSSALPRLGLVDLLNFGTSDLRLDAQPKRVLTVGTRVVIDHGTPEGMVTVLPDPTAKREDARVVWGFFLAGLLDDHLKD